MKEINEVGGVWAEINLDNIAHNIGELKRITRDGTILTGVLKADGYGHGAVAIADTLLKSGIDRFAVATISEAIELRQAGYSVPILIVSYTPDERLRDIVRYDITPTIYEYGQALKLNEEGIKAGKRSNVHLKVDTGMSRLGFMPCDASVSEVLKIAQLSNISIEGIFTHFALSFIEDKTFTHMQMKRFQIFVKSLEERGLYIPVKHVSNSATATDLPEYNLDMVRAGSILYGLPHQEGISKEKIDLRPAMTLKTRISNVSMLPPNVGVSYGHQFVTNQWTKIATIPAGYADGITRLGSGKMPALVSGSKVRQVGIICMDQCMLDVTGIDDVHVGDEVVILGSNGTNEITADEKANILGTGNCEIVCAITRRVPRVYISNGCVVKVVDYLNQGIRSVNE